MFKGRIDTLGLLLGFYYCLAPILVVSIAYVAMTFAVDDFAPAREFLASLRTVGVPLLGGVWATLSTLWMAGLLVRRWHDLNRSGYWALLGLVPVLGVAMLWLLVLYPGARDTNRFGQYRTPRRLFEVLLGGPTTRSTRESSTGVKSPSRQRSSSGHTLPNRHRQPHSRRPAVKEPQG